MFPLLFPYGLARIHEQARDCLSENDIRQLLYWHCTGAWGEHIVASRKKENMNSIGAKDGRVTSYFTVTLRTFKVTTYLNIDINDFGYDSNYVDFDCDQNKWANSLFPVKNITFISF